MAQDKDENEIVDSNIPKQVQENADMAEDLLEQMNADKTPSDEDDDQENPERNEVANEDESAEPAAEEGDTDTADENDEPTDWQAEYQKLEQKHKTLQGKYNAEAPGENSRADRLQNELTAFKAETIEKLKALTKEEPEADEPNPDMEARNARIQKMLDEYGDDYMDDLDAFVADRIEKGVEAKLAPIQEKLTATEEKQVEAAQNEFMTVVQNEITAESWEKDWTKQGSNPDFEAFLEAPDPSGLYTNGQLAEMYSDKGDAEKFAKLLNIFYQTQDDPTPEADPVTKAEVPAKKKETPDALVAPNRKAPSAVPKDDGDKIIWTEETMAAFYKKDSKNGYTPEESRKLWDDILLAPHEGRIATNH